MVFMAVHTRAVVEDSSLVGEKFERPVEIVMAMMIRDERVNIESNLGLWAEVIDYFVFMVDERTSDGSQEAIKKVLGGSKCKDYRILPYAFEGFGKARTLSLTNAYKEFPQATHVWIADPDWRPDLSTINKEDINVRNADAYRFLIYDRNGETTRRIDWLLRNREGLAMRYNLHEVLHIGEQYDWYGINWIVHEIEKPGTWHATVGHGNSMSAQRYHFDLALLEKDLVEYGHDPHTHYYLGVTNEAVAERMIVAGSDEKEVIDRHLDASIKYLTLRAESEYTSEFNEERWGVMMMLGTIFSALRPDFTKAERWLRACRDFNPHQTECSRTLCNLYATHGRAEPLIEETQFLLGVEQQGRIMLNHYKMGSCEIPKVVLNGLQVKFSTHPNEVVAEEAMLAFLLRAMVQDDFCAKSGVLLSQDTVASALQMEAAFGGQSWTPSGLCSDPQLVTYVTRKRIYLQPCSDLLETIKYMDTCNAVVLNPPSVTPTQQLLHARDSGRKLSGIGSIPDIVHHVYGGVSSMIMSKPEFNILYVAPWGTAGFMTLLKFMTENYTGHLRVTVISRDRALASSVQAIIDSCTMSRPVDITLKFRHEVTQFIDDALLAEVTDAAGPSGTYDYIDVNGGQETLTASMLALLRNLLSPGGVLGACAFSSNRHSEQILQLINARNVSAHAPFSTDGKRLVKAYLDDNDLSLVIEDEELVEFLSAGAEGPANLLTKRDMKAALSGAGFSVKSWVPTATLSPFEEMELYDVQKYRSFGLSEDDFLHNILVTFRYGVYAVCDDASKVAIPGRLRVADLVDADTIVQRNTYVIDRTGSLENIFKGAEYRAESKLSMEYVTMEPTFAGAVAHICMPTELRGYTLLGSGPNLHEIATANYVNNNAASRERLAAFLHFLESINAISLWTVPSEQPEGDTFVKSVRHNIAANKAIIRESFRREDNRKSNEGGIETYGTDTYVKSRTTNERFADTFAEEVEIGLSGEVASDAPIILPVTQTRNELARTSRHPGCRDASSASSPCLRPTSTWKTANISSKKKLQFDISQLKFIAFMNKSVTSYINKEIIPALQTTIKGLGKSDKTFLVPSDGWVNRAYFVAPEPKEGKIRLLNGAKKELIKGIHAIEDGDVAFSVVDVMLDPKDLMALSKMLLTTTGYYDYVNGAMFSGHPSDGLVQAALVDVVEDLVKTCSMRYQYKVKGFSVNLMDMNTENVGPLAINGPGEITLMLWLNPNIPEATTHTDMLYLDGARLYETAYAACLLNLNAIIDPTVHPHYLAIDGDLNTTGTKVCSVDTIGSETIARKANRLAVVGPNFSYRIGNAQQRSTSGRTFDVKTNVVLSITLSV
jgi:hypothetical protein